MLSDIQLQALRDIPGRVVVAYSGGCDSHALLHYLATSLDRSIEALHINHGLQTEADDWQAHCEQVCDDLNVPLTSFKVFVPRSGSIETNARAARYSVFERFLEVGDCLLFAHHQNDQIETILLNLNSGRAPFGVLGMPETRELGLGRLERPLLRVPQAELIDYARSACLKWLEDPSNADTRFERNRLRHDILPLLDEHYPELRGNLLTAWDRTSDVMLRMEEQAIDDLAHLQLGPGVLDLAGLIDLRPSRRDQCQSQFLKSIGYDKEPGQRLLQEIWSVMSNQSKSMSFDLGSVLLQSYQGRLYGLCKSAPESTPCVPIEGSINFSGGELTAGITKGHGVSVPVNQLCCQVRQGGEELLLRGYHHKLKNVFQEFHIPTLIRDHLPLIWLGDLCVGVCGVPDWQLPMIIADEYQVAAEDFGCELLWRPPTRSKGLI